MGLATAAARTIQSPLHVDQARQVPQMNDIPTFTWLSSTIIQCFPLQPLIAVSSRNSMARSTFGGQQARKNGDN